jgi:D-alanyl-lipoteichoic acid acyltransferase DltB (MBOAT superfamily)
MLFNSYEFIFVFLPIAFFVFYRLGKFGQNLAGLWLFAFSLFFYGWWNPAYVGLLLASILFNFGIGTALSRKTAPKSSGKGKALLAFGIVSNLTLLGYYKYANFFVHNMQGLLGLDWQIEPIILPLGISFFTFTQIAFLADAYRSEVKETNFIHYGLFVTYFPHLIAGPVLHHKEMMPQFAKASTYRLNWENLSVGLTIFTLGLFKKVVLADGIAPFANPVFTAAAQGEMLTFIEAWGGALAYTFQLYFDFSGYSDMAIGLSRLFGIKLPLNFDSPYKAINIIEFWRRWHITLSRFLRDYLYIPLGGSRKGQIRRYGNLLATMLLGGLWHGAGWTLILWGGLHGLYLIVNHAWHSLRVKLGHDIKKSTQLGRLAGMSLTFFVVVIAWIFFRATNLEAALALLSAMAGFHGVVLPGSWYNLYHWRIIEMLHTMDIDFGSMAHFNDGEGWWIMTLWILAWFAPNTQQIMARFSPALDDMPTTSRLLWQPNIAAMLVLSIILLYTLTEIGKVSEFLYFQF